MKKLILTSSIAVAGLTLLTTASPSAAAGDSCSGSARSRTAGAELQNIVDTALAAGRFETLAAALGAAELTGALQGEGPFTVFAPTDAAFAKLPAETLESLLLPENRAALTNILTYHVVPRRFAAESVVAADYAAALNGQRIPIEKSEEGLKIDGANLLATDILCSNGIIHVVDTILMPATTDLVDTAEAAGDFATLLTAVKSAGLSSALKGEGPFTVFAPTDAAFAALQPGTVESLLLHENRDQLTAILTYHVVPGRVYADQLENGPVGTLQGSQVKVAVGRQGVQIDGAQVLAADVESTNGVIHIIDKVLIPRP